MRLDRNAIVAAVEPAFAGIVRPASSATFAVSGSRVSVVPSQEGRRLDGEAIAQRIEARPTAKAVRVALVPIAPERSTADAQRMRIRELVSQFTTPHACCQPRVTNIQQGRLDPRRPDHPRRRRPSRSTPPSGSARAPAGSCRRPRSARAGCWRTPWAAGVSQTATTVYNAAFFAGLKIVTHTPHEFWITRYPAGREATVSWGGPELIVQNDWPAAILVKAYDTGTSLTVQMYSAKLGRSVSTETFGDPVEGTAFSVEYTRVVRQRGDGEARRALLVVVRGAARANVPDHGLVHDAFPVVQAFDEEVIRAGFRPAQMVLVAFLVTFGCVRFYTHSVRHGRGPGQPVGRRAARAPHGARHLPAARRRLHRVTADDDSLPWYLWWVLPTAFGVGAALVLDEFALWLNLRDVYWTEEGRRSIDAVIIAAALIAIVALGAPFWGKVISGADPAGGFLIVAYHVAQRGLRGRSAWPRAS